MNDSSFFGSLVPIWIIGAPLLFAFIELMKTPTPRVGASTAYRTGDAAYAPRPT